MINRTYYIEGADEENFIEAMWKLADMIPCFLELVDIDTVYIECRVEDAGTMERFLAPFI